MAAFASANLGDVSPNLSGAFCADPSKTCDPMTNTCGVFGTLFNYEPCYAVGPGEDMFESTYIIAERQFNKAMVSNDLSSPQSSPGWGFTNV